MKANEILSSSPLLSSSLFWMLPCSYSRLYSQPKHFLSLLSRCICLQFAHFKRYKHCREFMPTERDHGRSTHVKCSLILAKARKILETVLDESALWKLISSPESDPPARAQPALPYSHSFLPVLWISQPSLYPSGPFSLASPPTFL